MATFYSQVWGYRNQKLLQDFMGLNYFSPQPQTMTKSLHLKEIITDSQSVFSILCPWTSCPFPFLWLLCIPQEPHFAQSLCSGKKTMELWSAIWKAELTRWTVGSPPLSETCRISYRQNRYGSLWIGEGPGMKNLKHYWPNIRPWLWKTLVYARIKLAIHGPGLKITIYKQVLQNMFYYMSNNN